MKKIFFVLIGLVAFACTPQSGVAPAAPPPIIVTPPKPHIEPPPLPISKPSEPKDTVLDLTAQIKKIASDSKCAGINWQDRGVGPKAYFKGVALVFARAVCNQNRDDVVIVSSPKTNNDATDVLSWYNSNFTKLGMKNDGGLDNLRHVYALEISMGIYESDGKHCCGRDMSQGFSSSDSAEAGLFQTSWGVNRVSPVLSAMFKKYKTDASGCLLDVFSDGVSCSSGDAKNWGSGDGLDWQELTKKCPAFAVEYASVVMRLSGGTKGEFSTLRDKDAEITSECDKMLADVQDLVRANPTFCQ